MIRIGQKLKEERLRRRLSLDDVAKATKIRASFIAAIEEGDYAKLPSSAYALGFVRNYIEYLGLPKKETLAIFRREFDEEKMYRVLPSGFARQKKFSPLRFRLPQAILLIGVLFFLLIGFLAFQYRYVFISPPLRLAIPEDGAFLSQKELVVSGNTDSNAVVTVNNEPVIVEDNGDFSKTLSLFSGETIIEVRARHRLGKETVVTRHVIVRE